MPPAYSTAWQDEGAPKVEQSEAGSKFGRSLAAVAASAEAAVVVAAARSGNSRGCVGEAVAVPAET